MAETFSITHRVEFRDTDAAGIMHFSTFLTYMEETEHAFLRQLGLSVLHCQWEGIQISWPRVSVQCDYQHPLKFEEEFEVILGIERLGNRSISYGFEFFRRDNGAQADSSVNGLCAKGRMTVVCCRIHEDSMEAIEIPETIRNRMVPFVGEP